MLRNYCKLPMCLFHYLRVLAKGNVTVHPTDGQDSILDTGSNFSFGPISKRPLGPSRPLILFVCGVRRVQSEAIDFSLVLGQDSFVVYYYIPVHRYGAGRSFSYKCSQSHCWTWQYVLITVFRKHHLTILK